MTSLSTSSKNEARDGSVKVDFPALRGPSARLQPGSRRLWDRVHSQGGSSDGRRPIPAALVANPMWLEGDP